MAGCSGGVKRSISREVGGGVVGEARIHFRRMAAVRLAVLKKKFKGSFHRKLIKEHLVDLKVIRHHSCLLLNVVPVSDILNVAPV